MKKTLAIAFISLCTFAQTSIAQQPMSEAEASQFKQQYALPWMIPNWQSYSYTDLAKLYPVPAPDKKTARYEAFEKEKGDANTNQLARWHWYWAPRVSETGAFPDALQNYTEWTRIQQEQSAKKGGGIKSSTANWVNKTLPAPQGSAGVGRIDRIYPQNSNGTILWAGSPTGGLWYSSNSGTTWTIKNESMPLIGISGIAVDPTNTNTIYIATGDGEARQDQPTIGVYKSTDGGTTWAVTGLTNTAAAGSYMSRLVIDPNNTSTLFAATNNGLMRTTNGGTTWTQVLGGQVRDVRINPGNSSIVYCSSNAGVYRSTNGGASFTFISTAGLPASNFVRISLAVTPHAPNVVYALYANNAYSFLGLYKSSDAGVHWTLKSSTPTNLTGSQGWYALPIAVSPNDSNLVFVGGLQVYRSTDGGSTWSKKNPSSVHVDDHDLVFTADGSKLFLGCDGGVYQTTGSANTWNNLSNGLLNTQQYHLAVTPNNPNLVMYGAQDNDINVLSNSTWDGNNLQADGFEVAIDPANTAVMYGESQYGGLAKSTNGGAFFSDLSNSISATEQGNWDTPFLIDPNNHNTLIIGYMNIFKSTNAGSSWSKITNWTSGQVSYLAYYKANSKVIYALKGSSLYVTLNGGQSWQMQTAAGITGNRTAVAVCPWDSSRIWVTVSGYASGKKVYYSSNSGFTFSNVSGSLPNVPINNIYYQDSTEDGIYVATDIGVWAYDTTLHDWAAFTQGMPPVTVTEIELQKSSKTLYCSTYGRGMWSTTPYDFPKHTYVSLPNGVENTPPLSECSVFPNPSQDEIHINGTIGGATLQGATYELFAINGQLIQQSTFAAESPVIEIHSLSPGQYRLIIQKNAASQVLNFTKN